MMGGGGGSSDIDAQESKELQEQNDQYNQQLQEHQGQELDFIQGLQSQSGFNSGATKLAGVGGNTTPQSPVNLSDVFAGGRSTIG